MSAFFLLLCEEEKSVKYYAKIIKGHAVFYFRFG